MSKPTRISEQHIVDRRNQGWAWIQIAHEAGASISTCQRRVRGNPDIRCKRFGLAEHTERILELHGSGMSDPEIAAEIGCARQSIQEWRTRHGLPANLPPGAPKRRRDDLMALHNQGLRTLQIAEAAELPYSTVWSWKKRNGLL